MCEAQLYIIFRFVIEIVSIMFIMAGFPVLSLPSFQCMRKRGTYGAQLVLIEPQFKMLSTFKILFKVMYFWKVMQSGYEGKSAKNKKNLMNRSTS